MPLPPAVAALGVLACPVGCSPLDLAGGGIDPVFFHDDAAGKFRFRILFPVVWQHHAVK